METQRKLLYHFHEHVFLSKIGRNKVHHGKVCSTYGTVRRRARDRANIAAGHRTLRQNANNSCRWDAAPDTLCALTLSRRRKSKYGFHRFSILLCHSLTKRDIVMILSKHEVDIITKTVYVSSLHTVLILYF